jgi:hypothetical protein
MVHHLMYIRSRYEATENDNPEHNSFPAEAEAKALERGSRAETQFASAHSVRSRAACGADGKPVSGGHDIAKPS